MAADKIPWRSLRMPYFAHDGMDFHYCDMGAGLPIVFQHGLGSDLSQLVGLFQPPLGFRLLSMDFRAHGETRPLGPPEKISMAAFADDLLAFLDELGTIHSVVGGISMGAAVALNFALRFPDRVQALILARPCWLDSPLPANARVFVTIARFLQQYGAREGREQFRQSEEYQDIFRQWPQSAPSLLGLFDAPRAEETAVKLERIANDAPCRSLQELAAIGVPTLVLASRYDPVHPFEYGGILAQAIPGARLCEITAKSESESRYAADVQRSITEFLQTTFGSPP
jgi:pimeloyl-ACP methyl ester carboxylesterase